MIGDAELERWGEAAERGDYGGSKGPVMHGPVFLVDADYPDTVSLGVSMDTLALVDARAGRLGAEMHREDLESNRESVEEAHVQPGRIEPLG